MAYRKSTLRRLPPFTRKYARLLGDLDSVLRRGKNLLEEMSRLELDSRALAHARDKGTRATLQMPQNKEEPGSEV